MLPRSNRLTRSADFQTVVRRGRRAASATMVLHAAAANVSPRAAEKGLDPQPRSGGGTAPSGVRVGFVVGASVGNSVVRNRVKRRLRALLGQRLEQCAGLAVVVRATPGAASADSQRLAVDLDSCLARVSQRVP